jgi:pectate lyase
MPNAADRLVNTLRGFADTTLALCRDTPTGSGTPLLASFLDARTRQPLRLPAGHGQPGEIILSNLANQLNFLRVLHGLNALTGEASYRDRAQAICRFALRNTRRRGMLLWGNHAAVDLVSKRPVFLRVKGKVHEIKAHYPPYDLLWAADPVALEAHITFAWHAHVYDWSRLDFSRHGRMDLPDFTLPPEPWAAPYQGGPVFFIGGGLTFLNAGSDLYLAAATLSHLTGKPGPVIWSKRLLGRYVATRHPATGLGGYQFSSTFDKTDAATMRSGDQALRQFGEQFPDHNPLQGTLTDAGRMRMINGNSVLCRLHLARLLPDADGKAFGRAAVEDAEAYAHHTYEPGKNLFHPTFTDGFRLTGQVMQKAGYYGPAGRIFEPRAGDGLLFWSHAAAWRYAGSRLCWDVARSIGLHQGLGDIGETPGVTPRLAPQARAITPAFAFGLLELDAAFPAAGYLAAATYLAQRMAAERFQDGLCLGWNGQADMDAEEPLVLLHVAARLAGRSNDLLPFFSNAAQAERDGWVREDETDPA